MRWALVLLSSALLSSVVYFQFLTWLALISLVPLVYAVQLERNPWRAGLFNLIVGFSGILTAFYGVGFAYPLEVCVVVFTQSIWFFLPAFIAVALRLRLPPLEPVFPSVFACAWVAMETLVAQPGLLGAYANGSIAIGYTQFNTPLLPLAAWVGVSGVSFVVVLINGLLATVLSNSGYARSSWFSLGAIVCAVALVGLLPNQTREARAQPLRVGVVQVAPSNQLDEMATKDLLSFGGLTASYGKLGATTQGIDLAIWPEAAVRASSDDALRMSVLKQILKRNSDTLLGIFRRDGPRVFNSLMLWNSAEQSLTPVYDKRWLIGGFEDHFTPGAQSPVVKLKGVTVGLGICWESTFSSFALDLVRNGAEILVYPTSNVFAGPSVLPRLHAQVNTFRAVETGRFVVTASKGGPSVIIAPNGQWVRQSALGEQRLLRGEVLARVGWTPYVQFGNVMGWGAVMVTIGSLLVAISKSRFGRTRTAQHVVVGQKRLEV
jgi:apolipoprotein N-acyltransferase